MTRRHPAQAKIRLYVISGSVIRWQILSPLSPPVTQYGSKYDTPAVWWLPLMVNLNVMPPTLDQ